MKTSAPVVLQRTKREDSRVTVTVMATDAHWLVTYAGQACNIVTRKQPGLLSIYVKNGWPTRKHAENLARKMNLLFETDLFQAECVVGSNGKDDPSSLLKSID